MNNSVFDTFFISGAGLIYLKLFHEGWLNENPGVQRGWVNQNEQT